MIRDALRYLRGRPDLMLVLCMVFFAGTFGLNFQMTSALMSTQVFDQGATEYGLLGSIMAIGSLTGALMAARRTRDPAAARRRGRPRLRRGRDRRRTDADRTPPTSRSCRCSASPR